MGNAYLHAASSLGKHPHFLRRVLGVRAVRLAVYRLKSCAPQGFSDLAERSWILSGGCFRAAFPNLVETAWSAAFPLASPAQALLS